MPKSTTPSFNVTLPLDIEPWQIDRLNKIFRIACHLYNSALREMEKRMRMMMQTQKYQEAKYVIQNSTPNTIERIQAIKIKSELCKQYGIRKYDSARIVAPMQKHFNQNIHSQIGRKIAFNASRAINEVIWSKGKKVHYRKENNFLCIEGENNNTGIVYKDDTVYYCGLAIKVKRYPNNQYEAELLKNRVKYCKLKRKWIRTRWKYYVDIVLECAPPKTSLANYNSECLNSSRRVGIDIGVSTAAVVTSVATKLYVLAKETQSIENEIFALNRAMERSRRATNPQNYNLNGTIKKQQRVNGRIQKLQWDYSNHYRKLSGTKRELHRKQADVRKESHFILANTIIQLGSEIYVERMDFHKLAEKQKIRVARKPTTQYKPHFGKSISDRAPAMFIKILGDKANAAGGNLVKINTQKARASQYNHLTQEYKPKPLSQRWNHFPDGNTVQRDIYSAFLIRNINDKHDEIDQAACEKNYSTFLLNCKREGSQLLR